jgi:hypothetical protein
MALAALSSARPNSPPTQLPPPLLGQLLLFYFAAQQLSGASVLVSYPAALGLSPHSLTAAARSRATASRSLTDHSREAFAVAYSVISKRRRRDNPLAQRLTTAATRELYRDEDLQRPNHNPSRVEKAELGKSSATITQVRQGVRGHNAAIVLGVSLFLAAVVALALFTTLSFEPTSLGCYPSPDAAQTGRH